MIVLNLTNPPGGNAGEQAENGVEVVASAMGAHLPLTDPVLVFALVMAIILLAPLAMARLRVPGLIGVILAGAFVGPSGLGLLERTGVVETLGTVGLLYLIFVAGMSMDLHQFALMRSRSAVFGLLSFFIPQLMAVGVGMWLMGFNLPAALMIGSIVGTHTLLAYPVAKRIGITGNPAVTMTIGATIFTDILGLSLLAIAVALATGNLSLGFWLQFGGGVVVYVLAVLFALPVVGRWFFRNVRGPGEVEFMFLMVVLFMAAAGSRAVGLAPIVGAFFAGITMNRLVPDTGPLMNRLHFVGDALFIPFFLLSVGMLIDFRVLVKSADVWQAAGLFIGMVIVGKSLAALIAARVYGYGRLELITVIGLTIPQAAATLAVTLIGYDLDLFSTELVNAVVVMILVTCLIGPALVDSFGRRVALATEAAPLQTESSHLRILVPLANPSSAPALMEVAFMVRRPESLEPVYPLTVAFEGGDVAAKVAAGERMLGYAVTHASAAGVPVHAVTRVDTSIANGVSRAIVELRISTVVIGWSGEPSARRMIFGSVIDQLLETNPQTFLLCRLNTPLNTTRRVIMVVPRFLEREHGFGEAARTVKLMTSRLGAKLVVAAADSEIKHLQPRIGSIRPQVATTFTPISPLANVVPRLQSMIETDDLIVLMSTREGRLAWTPDLDRLPQRLASEFPGSNLIVFYGSEQSTEARAAASAAIPGTSGLLAPERVALGIPSLSFDQALEHVLRPHFRTLPSAMREVRDALIRNANEYSTEMSPGVALLHAHVPHVSTPTFFLATCPSGLTLPRIARPVRMMLVLLSPTHLPPERHLQSLANIGRLMRSAEVIDRVMGVTSFGELEQLFTPTETSGAAPAAGGE